MELPGIIDGFVSSMESYRDIRSQNYPLLQGVTPLVVILSVYLYFCISLGPSLMKSRAAFQLKRPIFLYNLLNIIVSVWLMNEVIQSGFFRHFGFSCQPMFKSVSPPAMRVARSMWVYFLLKIFELLDTIFFVLRKKDNQVTLLHIYHHTSTPIIAWIVAKFLPVGQCTLDKFLNTGVHVIMYSYYLLSSLGPQYQKYLWWKKYLTGIQIGQLVIVVVHHTQILFSDCDYFKSVSAILALSTAFNLYQFVLFFRRSYSKERKTN